MAMSRDGLLPKKFSSIHPKFKTPWFATIITGFVVAIPALFMNLTEVTDLASIGTLFAFVVVCAGVLFKDVEFGREKRFVPYINGQLIVPVLLLIAAGLLYYLNPEAVSNFFKIIPAEGETAFAAFTHKIPMIAFLLLCIGLGIATIVKKLTFIPVAGLLLCAYLMTELGVTNWTRFAVWLLFGMSIYFGYGYVHSHLQGDYTRAKKLNSNLILASIGFLAAALGLGISAFTFISDLLIYFFPTLTVNFVFNFEVGLFFTGLIAGLIGVFSERSRGAKDQA